MISEPIKKIDWAHINYSIGDKYTYMRKFVNKKELNTIADHAFEINKIIERVNDEVENYEETNKR